MCRHDKIRRNIFVRGDRGQAVPMMVLLLLAAGIAVVAITRLGIAADDAARARTAADAAALAGAAQGQAFASALATANGGELLDYQTFGNFVEVRVRVGSSDALARAEREVVWEPSRETSPTQLSYTLLQPPIELAVS